MTCTRIVELGDLMDVALPHLMVVDVMLPDGDGGDITELLRNAWPGIPAMFVSAANRERLAELAPIGPVVAKPFDLDAFHSRRRGGAGEAPASCAPRRDRGGAQPAGAVRCGPQPGHHGLVLLALDGR